MHTHLYYTVLPSEKITYEQLSASFIIYILDLGLKGETSVRINMYVFTVQSLQNEQSVTSSIYLFVPLCRVEA